MLNALDPGNGGKNGPPKSETFHTITSILALGLISVLVIRLFWNFTLPRKDFYNELWGPAYLLLQGRSPYATSSLNPVLPAAWFPMAIGFFFAVGLLPEDTSLKVWFIFNIIEICVIVYLTQGKARTLYNTVVAALLCFFFPPILNHFNLGQISITVTMCVVLAVQFVNKYQEWVTAFLIALAFSKPHLAVFSGLGLSYYFYQLGKTNKIVLFWGKLLLMILLLCVPLFIANVNWVPDAIASMLKNPPWSYPSLLSLFLAYLGSWGYIVWGLTTALIIGVCYLLWKLLPIQNSIYWSLGLVLLASPYIGSWDFVAMLPLLIFTYARADWKRKTLIVISYVAAWYGMALVQAQNNSENYSFWWVPVWLIIILALVTDWRSDLHREDALGLASSRHPTIYLSGSGR